MWDEEPTHESRLMHGHHKKFLIPLSICRCQEINLTVLSKYCLKGKAPWDQTINLISRILHKYYVGPTEGWYGIYFFIFDYLFI